MTLREEGFWDQHYALELRNYEDDGDEGEVWFGKGLSRKIASWVAGRLVENSSGSRRAKLIDVGCGNSFTICCLVDKLIQITGKEDWEELVDIIGVDYSSKSIDLSKKIISHRNLSHDSISLEQCDFLDSDKVASITKNSKYDYIIDIGTYDAICLLASQSNERLSKCRREYLKSLQSLTKEGTIFVLASCNYTKDELLEFLKLIEAGPESFRNLGQIETPKMQFAGKEGSQVTCLLLEFK